MPLIERVDDDAFPPDDEEEKSDQSDPNPITLPRFSPFASSLQSMPKRQKPSTALVEAAPNPFDESLSVEQRLNQPDDDECIICRDGFVFPVVECLECRNLMCERCLSAWSKTQNARNSSGIEVVASCPNCRSTKGYEGNTYMNRKLGKRIVACELCLEKMTQDELKPHMTNRCLKRKVACAYAKWGCDWIGTFDYRDEHQNRCMYLNASVATAKVESMKAAFKQELLEMRREKDLLMDDLMSVIEKARQNLESQVSALSALQRAALHGEVSMFAKGRRKDSVSAVMRSAAGRTLDLHIRIDVDSDRFYSLYVSFTDSSARFPIWLAVFLLDPNAKGIDSPCKVANFYFRNRKEEFPLYTELDEGQSREEALVTRSDTIQFGIAGSILFNGESRI